tara:strand:- start:202 stop:1197 length:996 start_codon:yes stop_codon:yes gene_type:complete
MTQTYQALVLVKDGESINGELRTLDLPTLGENDVRIKVLWSSVNYKDGLATLPNGGVVREYPRVPGIDLAGIVAASDDSRFKEGETVLATGFGTGVSHDGGYAKYATIPGDWVLKCPKNMSPREAMIFGTAGFTAALALERLEHEGLQPSSGPILVTGATGGVGSMAISLLSKLGYEVHASTGKKNEQNYLETLGATRILTREEVSEKSRPLEKGKWAGAIDQVGGTTLSWILSNLRYQGAVACTGLTGGVKYSSTVLPLLLRSVSILGVDSVMYPHHLRPKLWDRMANELKPDNLELMATELVLQETLPVLKEILKGQVRGRKIVRVDQE